MNTEEELEKIDFFKRTNFKGFARGLSKPSAKAGTDVSGLESRQLTAGTLPPPPDLGTPYCSMNGEGGSGFSTGLNKPVTDSYKKPRKEGNDKDDKQ